MGKPEPARLSLRDRNLIGIVSRHDERGTRRGCEHHRCLSSRHCGVRTALRARGRRSGDGNAGTSAAPSRSCFPRAASKPSSQSRKLSAIRRFFLFLYSEGVRPDNPCGTIDSPRLTRPLPKMLSPAEALALIDAARLHAPDTPETKRLHCMIEMLYASGLRVSELVGLPFAAVRGAQRVIFVRGKGGRERMAPLGEPAREALGRICRFAPFHTARAEPRGAISVSLPRRLRAPDAPPLPSTVEGTGVRGRT